MEVRKQCERVEGSGTGLEGEHLFQNSIAARKLG